MRIVVTGASGFIGGYLTEALLDGGHEVIAVGRHSRARADNFSAAATDYSEESLKQLLDGADAIVHLAGRRMTREDEPTRLFPFVEPNVIATENLLRAAKAQGVSNLVLASTIAVYSAANEVPFRETAVPKPLNAYGLSKLMAEQYADLYGSAAGIRVTNLRFAAVYGHGEKGTPALMRFINEAQQKKTLTLQGNRAISIDQLYVRDAVSATLAALAPANPGGTFNIGAGTAYAVVELAEAVNSVFGNAGNLSLGSSYEAPARKSCMDITRAAELLEWSPQFGLAEGLADFLATSNRACNI